MIHKSYDSVEDLDHFKMMYWNHQNGDFYLVTGIDRNGKRFSIKTENWFHAMGINVWRGSKWLIRNGKRILLQRVYN